MSGLVSKTDHDGGWRLRSTLTFTAVPFIRYFPHDGNKNDQPNPVKGRFILAHSSRGPFYHGEESLGVGVGATQSHGIHSQEE